MCAVSFIGDYYGHRYPHWPSYPLPQPGQVWPIDPIEKAKEDAEKMRKFLELIEKAKETDKVMGEPDCAGVGQKEFIKQVTDRLDAIERRLAEIGK